MLDYNFMPFFSISNLTKQSQLFTDPLSLTNEFPLDVDLSRVLKVKLNIRLVEEKEGEVRQFNIQEPF